MIKKSLTKQLSGFWVAFPVAILYFIFEKPFFSFGCLHAGLQ
jgi:hypothetical protein